MDGLNASVLWIEREILQAVALEVLMKILKIYKVDIIKHTSGITATGLDGINCSVTTSLYNFLLAVLKHHAIESHQHLYMKKGAATDCKTSFLTVKTGSSSNIHRLQNSRGIGLGGPNTTVRYRRTLSTRTLTWLMQLWRKIDKQSRVFFYSTTSSTK